MTVEEHMDKCRQVLDELEKILEQKDEQSLLDAVEQVRGALRKYNRSLPMDTAARCRHFGVQDCAHCGDERCGDRIVNIGDGDFDSE